MGSCRYGKDKESAHWRGAAIWARGRGVGLPLAAGNHGVPGGVVAPSSTH
jgi:hypothetical protein